MDTLSSVAEARLVTLALPGPHVSAAAVAATLATVPGEHWWREVPTRETWGAEPSVGAPGVLVRRAREGLERRLPEGARAQPLQGPLERLSWVALPVALRRWLASRFAWQARAYLALVARPTVVDLTVALRLAPDAFSEDARVAVNAVVREVRERTLGEARPLGYRGPDEWYVRGQR